MEGNTARLHVYNTRFISYAINAAPWLAEHQLELDGY
jgi:hypothetical protein